MKVSIQKPNLIADEEAIQNVDVNVRQEGSLQDSDSTKGQ